MEMDSSITFIHNIARQTNAAHDAIGIMTYKYIPTRTFDSILKNHHEHNISKQEMHLLMCCRQHQKPKRATRDVKGRIDE